MKLIHSWKLSLLLVAWLANLLLSACAPTSPSPTPTPAPAAASTPSPAPPTLTPSPLPPMATPTAAPAFSKWDLWKAGTQLRGANIYQRRIYPDLDGTEFLGPGPFGPPYTQADFDRLAQLGANYVNISGSGVFTIEPPYVVDQEAVAHLDQLIEMATQADLFVVITFRSGPGRGEFDIFGEADWLPGNYFVNKVWEQPEARAAWAEMWRYAAERYRDNPVVVGYDLMCEPNSNAGLDLWNPDEFYAMYKGTGYDWNSWYPDLVKAIREVDQETPILVGGNSFSGVEWLPYLEPVEDDYIVYTIHQYSPHEYTHQEIPNPFHTYPGRFDVDYDNVPETFDRAWLENFLAMAADFQAKHGVRLAVNEYGLMRWTRNGADYVRDEMELFEQHGWNYAVWQWHAFWPPLAEGDNSFNFLFGANPLNLTETSNDLWAAYQQAWGRNLMRPSSVGAQRP